MIEFLAELADYETTLYLLRYRAPHGSLEGDDRQTEGGIQACDPAMIQLCWDDRLFGMKPVRRGKIDDRSYSVDVQHLEALIMGGSIPEKVERLQCRFLIWQAYPGVVDSLKVEKVHLLLLDLCRGIMTTGELIGALQGNRDAGIDREEIAGILREWFMKGLITLEMPGRD